MAKAKAYYEQLIALSDPSGSDRPELKQARGFLAKK
jgi:hypothetical protein